MIKMVETRRAAIASALLIAAMVARSAAAAPASLEVRPAGGGSALSVKDIGTFHLTPNRVAHAELLAVAGTPVLLALWAEQTGASWTPFYAISLDGKQMTAAKPARYDLMLRFQSFDPLVSTPRAASQPKERGQLAIVQFVTQPLPVFLDHIRALGGRPYKFLANQAFLVGLPAEARRRVAALPFVRWVGPYRWFYRLEEPLAAQLLARSNSLGTARYSIQLIERGPAAQEAVERRIEADGGMVELLTPEGYRMEATLDADQLRRVARMDEVLFIDTWEPPENDMDQVRQMPLLTNGVQGGANYIEAVAGYTGMGVRAEVMDAGVRATHVDFAGTLLPHGPQSVASHGTSTTGINFGKGIGNPRARGMVPDAQGITAFYGGLTDRYQHTAQLLDAPYFAVYQSNSWGSGTTRDYTTVTAEMDDILFHLDFVVLQSQSNTASQLSRPQAWAKNIVSVGGLRHYHHLDMETHCWCHSASIGPAADGRIKPDLAHFNDLVFTTTTSGTSDTAYTSGFNGTSAATPIVAGHFGLFFQMWHSGIFGNPTGMTVFDSRPHMTTAKAMMINTARQWTFSGAADDRTRVHQGWGMPDLANLYDLRDRILVVDETDVLMPLESIGYLVTVTAGGPPLKATMVYKDPPGTTSSTLHRINDLDLKLTSPSGTVYWGNNGLLADMWSAPGGESDRLNTVENVFVQSPEPGTWMVEVIGTEIHEDSHLQTPDVVDADYALVVSGLAPRLPAP